MQFTLVARCFLVYSTKINCGRRSVPLAFLLHFFLKCSPTETASERRARGPRPFRALRVRFHREGQGCQRECGRENDACPSLQIFCLMKTDNFEVSVVLFLSLCKSCLSVPAVALPRRPPGNRPPAAVRD